MSSQSDHKDGVLHLQQHSKRRIIKFSGIAKSITEFLSDALEKAKDLAFPEAIKQAVPWAEHVIGTTAEVTGDLIPPVKFLLKLAERITEIDDPEELGHLVCTIAFERTAEQVIREVGGPVEPKSAIKDVREQLSLLEPTEEVDLGALTYEDATNHEFFRRAEGHLQASLIFVGYNGPQIARITNEVKDRFVVCLRTLLSQRDTAEKFAPFKEYIELGGAKERLAYKALAEHAGYQCWLFEKAPVLGKFPFALQHVYVETDCGKLTWGEINSPEERLSSQYSAQRKNIKQGKLDPFSEQNGGRQPLVQTVMELIGSLKQRDPIVIQGVAGAGKSSFTLRLCVELLRHQLRPIRIRLKDLRLDKSHISEVLPQAVRISDEQHSPDGVPATPQDLFRGNRIFRERGSGKYEKICRYVIILDGWDEISVSNEGFRRRIERMLEQLRSEYIDNTTYPFPIRIIITGRPSPDVTESGFLREGTPILTLRSLTPEQLRTFIQKLFGIVQAPPLHPPEEDIWPTFELRKFEPVFSKYTSEFNNIKDQLWPERERSRTGSLSALGLPLLAQLAARLISVWTEDPQHLVNNPTTLYRNLVNLTYKKGGKAENDDATLDDLGNQSRIVGDDLRELLWQTASAMTIYGKDLIPYEELSRRLNLKDEALNERVSRATSKRTLSALLISFYFKGGVQHLGCEFVHKSFREYLLAEAIVETLKRYGAETIIYTPEREKYWKDFDKGDKRYSFSRSLAQFLAPQWLSQEVVFHIDNLLDWEISRSINGELTNEAGIATQALSWNGWRRVRDGLADLWDWWGEGVHLRPQPDEENRRALIYKTPYVIDLIEYSLPYDSTLVEPQPPRTTTMDAHLGAGLFMLCEAVCYYLAINHTEVSTAPASSKEMQGLVRKYQTRVGQENDVRFAPAGPKPEYFNNYIHRINSAGWRARGDFPSFIDLRKVDLASANLNGINLTGASLVGANLNGASLVGINLGGASLNGANLNGVNLNGANLNGANLNGASLDGASLNGANLNGASLSGASLVGANFVEASLNGASLVGASLVEANLNGASFVEADLDGANLNRASLNRAKLNGASFVGANLNEAKLKKASLLGSDLLGSFGLTKEQVAESICDATTKLPSI